MTASLARRGFLRGLTTLPLIGGGVSLIGTPTAVAAPITSGLLRDYETFLAIELNRLALEVRGSTDCVHTSLHGQAWKWFRATGEMSPPSTRAALVLSAIGCDWQEGGQ